MYQSIKERGRAASDHYAGSEEYFSLSPAGLTLLDALSPMVERYCRGRVLDAGAGRGAYRRLLNTYSEEYIGMDIAASSETSVVGDVQALPFADECFDTVFCSQVLEHVPEPKAALSEFRRLLRPGGHLILTVPHMSWLHNEPHDYFRFTRHGLAHLFETTGFVLKTMSPAGGLLSLLGHIPATLCVNSTFGIPVVHPVARVLNKLWVRGVAWVDERVEKKKIFALNYVCVTVKGEM